MDKLFSRIASNCAQGMGRPIAFILACIGVLVWGVTGPAFGWSDTWQLIINTPTTILTFLAVFLLQNSQTRDTKAIHAKLDELIAATADARDDIEHIENLTEAEIDELRR